MELRKASTILGCGCAGLITLFMAFVVTVTWATYRSGRELTRLAEDPEAAAARVREVLPYDELPAGYRPVGVLSVPLVVDVAFLLAPAPAAADGGAATAEEVERGFLFVRLRDWLGRGARTDWLEADGGEDLPVRQEGLDFAPREVVSRGSLTAGGAAVDWLSRRGDMAIDSELFGAAEDGDGTADGPASAERRPSLLTMMAVDCPGDDGRQRLGVWFAPDPAPDRPAAQVDWSATPADPAAIADFLGRLRLCG